MNVALDERRYGWMTLVMDSHRGEGLSIENGTIAVDNRGQLMKLAMMTVAVMTVTVIDCWRCTIDNHRGDNCRSGWL